MFLYREYTLARLPQYSLTPDPSHVQRLSTHKVENTEDLGDVLPHDGCDRVSSSHRGIHGSNRCTHCTVEVYGSHGSSFLGHLGAFV